MPSTHDITGLILAGGSSRRFGRDKATALVDGQPMIVHVYDALVPVVDEVLVSVRSEARSIDLPCRVVVDRHPGTGPLAGLHAGLLESKHPWLLAVACDLPFLTSEILSSLVQAHGTSDEAVVARTPDGRLQPLCALYPHAVLDVAERMLASEQRALLDLLEQIQYRDVLLPPGPLRNVNCPSDLER